MHYQRMFQITGCVLTTCITEGSHSSVLIQPKTVRSSATLQVKRLRARQEIEYRIELKSKFGQL